jgi:alpha-ketoglutarate-dependent taurine dioxygenase
MTSTEVRPGRDDPSPKVARRIRVEPFGVEVGPVTHLAAERDRLAALTWEHVHVAPMSATIGAELSGVDLRNELPDAVIAEIRAALNSFKVIFFRNQPITPAQHVAFARRFGELEIHPFIPANAQQPELVRFEKTADIGGYENLWHSDVSWREVPSMGAILHAVEVPDRGGDTLFADMTAAYDGLDDTTKERIAGMVAVHDYMRTFGHIVPPDKREETRAKYPPVRHPVVRTHPETARKILYLNRNFADYIEGLEADESVDLMNELCRTAETVEYQCRFSWEPHSVAFWDNRSVQHYASSDYWPHRRVMERASIIGDRPA